MKKFLPIILGSDINSYQIARSVCEEYNVNPVICDYEIKEPFIGSIYNNLYIESNITNSDEAFTNIMNNIYEYNKDNFDYFIIFAAHESYLNLIFKNESKIDFDFIVPYQSYGPDFTNKDRLYEILDELDFDYPKTQKISNSNTNLIDFEDDILIRPMDITEYNKLNFENKENSYRTESKTDAIKIIQNIYSNGYTGDILIQDFIEGKDGNQFTVNGYRSKTGKIYKSQARSILTDDLGSHAVQIDSNIEPLNFMVDEIIDRLNYNGHFNIDFKISDKDGKIYITAINTRLGNTFYYANLSGINLIKLAIDDLICNNLLNEEINLNKFGINIYSDELTKNFITSGLFLEYKDNDRAENTINPLLSPNDMGSDRKDIINSFLENELHKRIKTRGINEPKYK